MLDCLTEAQVVRVVVARLFAQGERSSESDATPSLKAEVHTASAAQEPETSQEHGEKAHI
eukprot:5538505-Amphidinium_carterae.1